MLETDACPWVHDKYSTIYQKKDSFFDSGLGRLFSIYCVEVHFLFAMLDSLGQYLQISLYIHLAGHEPPSVINEKKGGSTLSKDNYQI